MTAEKIGPKTECGDSKATPQVHPVSDTASSSSFEGRHGHIKPVDCAFDATEDPRYYKPIPEYEGIHRWDPAFEWTEAEEKAVVRKVSSKMVCKLIHRSCMLSCLARLTGESAPLPASPSLPCSWIEGMSFRPLPTTCWVNWA